MVHGLNLISLKFNQLKSIRTKNEIGIKQMDAKRLMLRDDEQNF